jgi:hypothetical protein
VEALDTAAAPGSPGASDAPAAAEVLITWRTPARRRWSCIAWSVLALLAAIAIEVTGPRRPVSFGMRLPLLVAVCGGLWCAARWRRRVVVTRAEVVVCTLLRSRRVPYGAGGAGVVARARGGLVLPGRRPVPPAPTMMTPWLVMSTAVIVALGCAKILMAAPRMSGALVAVSAGMFIAALAACWRRDRGGRPRAARPARRGPGGGLG